MNENLTEIGLEAFENNQNNFFERFRQIITEDESSMDETTQITVFCNFDREDVLYFRFEISTCRMNLLTDYYRFDYTFNESVRNNVDEITSSQEDVQIFVYNGNDISDNYNEY
jgi:hypothetical protein